MWIQTIRYKYEKISHVYSKGAYNIKNADVYIVVTKFDPKMDSWGLISSYRQIELIAWQCCLLDWDEVYVH